MALTTITSGGIAALAVDTAQLAADAVTNAKIEDLAVDTEHLADDAVDGDEIAAGAIDASHLGMAKAFLQLVHTQEGNNDRNTDSNSYVDIAGNTPSITTTKANSDILIVAYSGMSNGSDGSAAQYNLKRAISGGATTNEIWAGTRGICESRHGWGPCSWMYLDSLSESSGTTITYTIRMRVTSGSGGRAYWGYSNGMQSLTLIEIAP